MKSWTLLLTLIIGAASAQTATPATPIIPVPSVEVANIAGTSISLEQFEREFNLATARLLNQQGSAYSLEAAMQFYPARKDILKQFVDRQAITLEAVKMGVVVSDKEVKDETTKATQSFPDPAALDAALKQSGFQNAAQLEGLIRENLTYRKYITQLAKRYTFNTTIIQAYYNTHKAEYSKPAQACVKHILLANADDAAKAKARLDAGEDFAKVAGELSTDPGSKTQGGDLGCFAKGETVPEFDKASFEGEIGKLQQVKTQFGEHLLMVNKRNDATVTSLKDASPAIQKILADGAATRFTQGASKRLKIVTFPERVAKEAPPAPAPAPLAPTPVEPPKK